MAIRPDDKTKFITPQVGTVFDRKKTLADLDPDKVLEAEKKFTQERLVETLQKRGILPPSTRADKNEPIKTRGLTETGTGTSTDEETGIKETIIPKAPEEETPIKEEEATPPANFERVQDIAERLASGTDKDLESAGLASINFLDDRRVASVLKDSFGFSDADVQNIIKQRNEIRTGQRDIADVEARAAKASQATEDIFARQLEERERQLREQGQRAMETTQRLNSLRGAGRGSVNRKAIEQQQGQVDGLIAAAQKDSADKLLLRQLEIEGAEAEAIAAVRDRISDNEEALKTKLNEVIEKQSSLNELIKADFEESFDNSIALLEAGGEDVSNIDKEKSTKYLLNKDGTLFKTKGGKFVQLKESENDPVVINGYVKEILSDTFKLEQVPKDMQSDVVKLLSAQRGETTSITLTPLKQVQARQVAKTYFGNTSEDSVKAVEALFLQGKTKGEIESMLSGAGFDPNTPIAYENAIGSITRKGFSKDDKAGVLSEYQRRLAEFGANSQEVNEYLLGAAVDGVPLESGKKVDAKIQTINAIADIQKALDEYISKGGDTGIITGNIENVSQRIFGETQDADLAEIGNRIQLAIQAYRQGVSGAAFSESEALEYENIFPTGTKSIELNQAKMDALTKTFGQFTNDFYKGRLGASAFNEIFPNGVMGTLNPTFKGKQTFTFDPEESTQLDDIFGATETQTTTTEEPFKTSSGFQFDFNTPDQTGGSKEVGLKIQTDIDRIAKGSPVKAIDVVNIATKRQINPAILAAFLRNDSNFGTKGLGGKNNNPGNVGQFDRFGTQGVEGFATIQEGIDAAAENLQKRVLAFKKINPNREPTAFELATGKTRDGKKFFGVYMTDPKGPERVQQIADQLIS